MKVDVDRVWHAVQTEDDGRKKVRSSAAEGTGKRDILVRRGADVI
jgi:hypothetical protein